MNFKLKVVGAFAVLAVLASPVATSSVLGRGGSAIGAIRSELSSEMRSVTSREASAPVTSTASAKLSEKEKDAATKRAAAKEKAAGEKRFTKAAAKHRAAAKRKKAEAKHFKFTVKDGHGRPGRWNPCQAIPILVNLKGAPTGAMADLKAAVRNIDAASGLDFVIKGTTSARPSLDWGTTEWSGAPGKWAPVLIAFGNPGAGSLTDDGSSGVASPVWVEGGGHEVFVSGSIVFNKKQNSLYKRGFGNGLRRGVLFEHELGHLAGLEHVKDKHQVMYPEIGQAEKLGAGDRKGLEILGSGGCLSVDAPGW